MNNKKFAVIGTQPISISTYMPSIGVIIVDELRKIKEELRKIKEDSYVDFSEPTPYSELPKSEEKKFICKGKHQYREVRNEATGKVDWICQCSRNAND